MKNFGLLKKSIISLCLVLGVFVMAFGAVTISNYYTAQKNACSLVAVQGSEEAGAETRYGGEYTFPSALETEKADSSDSEIVFADEASDIAQSIDDASNSKVENEEEVGVNFTIRFSVGSGGSASCWAEEEYYDIRTLSWKTKWNSVSGSRSCPATDGYYVYIKVKINSINSGYDYATFEGTRLYAGQTIYTFAYGSTSYSVSFGKLPSYTVKYYGNGNTSGSVPGSQTFKQGNTVNIKGRNTLTKTGYYFDGWNTSSSGSGYSYAVGEVYGTYSNLNLYAQWVANSYTISFNANGGYGGTSKSVKYDSWYSMPSAPTRSGYTFLGWSADSSATSASWSNSGVTKQCKGNYTWYAVWKQNNYSLSVTKDSNITSATASSYSISVGSSTNIYATPKEGYYFKNWTISSGSGTFGSSTTANTTFKPTNHSTIKANSAIETYTLKFDSNGGSACSDIKKTYDSAITLPTPTKECYTFKGWYRSETSDNGSGTQFTATKMPDLGNNNASVTLYAKWEVNKVDLTFNLDAGVSKIQYKINSGSFVNLTANKTVEDVDALSTIEVVASTKSGYTWSGFVFGANDKYNLTSGSLSALTFKFQPKGNITLSAKTFVNVKLIPASDMYGDYTENASGGSVGFSSSSLSGTTSSTTTHGGSKTIYAKPGYACTFLGFYSSLTKLNDSSTSNDADDNLNLNPSELNGVRSATITNITTETIVYAVFKFITNNVNAYAYSSDGQTFGSSPDSVGGVVAVSGDTTPDATSTVAVRYTTETSVTATAKQGYKFIGWYDSLEALKNDTKNTSCISTDPIYTFNMPNSVVNYYAKFMKLFTLTLNYTAGISSFSVSGAESLAEKVQGATIVANTAQFYYGQSLGSIICNVDSVRYNWYKWEIASANAPSLINSQLSSAEIRNITMPNYDFALTAYASPKSFGLNVYAVYTDNGEYVVGNSRGGTVQINNETASASLTDFQVTYGTNFAHGTNNAVTITAKSNSNYTFVGWFNQITGTFEYGSIVDALSTNATMTIDKINEDGLSYYAVFVKNYNLYVYFDPQIFSINLTNSVIKSTSDNVYLQGTYYYGQPIPNLSAEIVAQGYKFKNWGVASGDLAPKNFDNLAVSTDGNSSNQANLFMCAGDSSLYPTFDYREYTLYLKANYSDTTSFVLGNQGGQIQIQSRSPAYNDAKIFKYKDKITLLATPSEGYALYGWFKFNSSDVRTLPNDYSNLLNNEIISTPQITVDMDYQSITYIALFKKTYSLELSYSTGISSVSKTPEKDFYFYNEKVQIDATPTSGYADDFDVWIIASSSDTPSIFNESLKQQTITIQGNYEFIATSAFNYLLNYHIMTENPDGTFSEDLAGGDLTGLKNGKMVAGMNISSLVITNENFIFDWFYLDDNFTQAFGNKATNTAIMPAETLDVYLKFTRKTFTISIANFETLASDNSTLATSDTKRLSANKYILRYQETAILSVNLKAFPGWELYGIYTDSRFANLHILGEDIFNPNTGVYTCDSLPANAENLTYYAMFKRITYDIGVNKSHDEISVNVPSTAYFGQTISFTCQMPIYLTGLSVSVTGPNSQVHLSNASGTYFFTMPSYAVTVNANADRPYVALTYDANGGSFGNAYVTNAGGQVLGGVLYYDNLYQYYSNIDKTATINGVPVPQRIGYTFLGFANANNLKYVSFNPSNNQYSYQTFAVNEPTTLYAIWDISTPILKVDTLKAQTVEYNGEVQDVYKIVIENQAHDIGYIYTWTNDATGEVVSNTSVLSVLNVVDSGSYTCKVVAGDKWAEISAEIQITKKAMKVDVNDSITYLKGTQLALSDANLVGLLNVHTLQSGKLVFNDVDDIAIDITLKLKGTDTASQKGTNIVHNYDISLAKYLTVKEKASLFTINVANYERTIDDSTFQNIYSETVLGGSSVNLAYSKPLEVVTETLASGVATNMIDDINVGGELYLGLSVPANYELVEVFVNGLAISSYIYSNNILAFVLNSEFVVDETCDIQIYFSKEALVTLHYNLNSSEISAGNAGYTSDKIIQTKGQAFIGPNQNTFFRNGFDFDGWYFTDSLALKVDGIWSIVGETNLYAKWNLEGLSAQNLTLTIKDNGNIVQSVNRAYNAKSVELSVAHIHPQVNLEISWLKDGISINKTANPLSIVNASESGLYTFIVTATFQGQSLEVVSSDIGLVANIKILKAQVDISSINFGITKVYDADTRLYNPQTRLDYYIFNTGVNNESMQLKGKYASPNVVINGTEIGDIQIVDLTFVGVNGAIVSNYSFVGEVYGKITPFAYIIDKRDSKVYDGQIFNVQYTGNSIVYPLTGIRHNIEYTLTTDSENAGFYTGNSGLYYNFVVKDSNGLIILSNNFTVTMSGTSSVEIMKADLANNLFFDNENLVYDTQTHMIYIKEGSTTLSNGQLPAGASQVVYKHLGVEVSTGFMNAGSYIIVAEITGDHNHNNKTLSATLTIAKRNFSVNFEYDREPILPTYLYIEDRNMYNGLKVIAVDRTDTNANIVPKVDKVVTFEGRETTTVTQVGNYTISLKTITGFDAQNFTLLGNDSFTFNIKELILGTDAMTFEDATYTYNARDYLEVFAKNVVHNHQVEIIATTYEKQVDGDFVSTNEAINVGVYKVTHEIAPTVAGVVLDQTLFSATLTIIPYTIQLKTPTEILFSKDYGQQDPTLTQTLYYFDIEVVVQYEREEGEDVGTYAIKNPNLLLNSTEIQNNFVLSEFNDTFKAFEIKKLKGERNLILIRQVKNLTQEYDGQEKTKLNFATLPSDVFSVVKFNENGVLEDVEKYNLTNIEFGFSGVNFAKDCGSYNLVLNSFESTTHELVSYIGAGFVYEITPIEVTISGDFGKTYDGTTIVDTSKLTLNGTNEEIDFAGNYVQKSVFKNGNEILDVVIEFEICSQNYKIAKIGGQDYKGKIYPREITVAYAEGGLDKIFDKSAIMLTNQLALNNVVDGDIVDFSGVYADINSGSDIAITFSTTNENYAITGNYAGNITPYEYSAILTNNKEYDGELFAVIQQDTIYFATSSLSETIYFKIETTGSAVGKYPDSNGNALTSTLCDINGEAVQNPNIILTVGNETYLEIKDRPITLNLNYGNPSNFVDNGQISNTDVKSFKVIYGTKLSDAINGAQDLPIPSKVGYKFDGWFLDASNSQAFDKNTQVYGESGIFAIGNLKTTEYTITLYAKWTIQSYNVTIKTYTENVSDDNFQLSFEGGEVVLNEQVLAETTVSTSWQYYSNASIKVSPNEHFVVDDVLRNGVSIYQNTNNIVLDKIFEASGNIVFEIKLAREVYNITINKNPPHNFVADDVVVVGTGWQFNGNTAIKTLKYGQSTTLPELSLTGQIFNGYAYFKSGIKEYFTDLSQAVSPTTNIDFEAVWNSKTIKIYFNFYGGTLEDESAVRVEDDRYYIEVEYGNAFGALPTPVRAGYVFAGYDLYDNGVFVCEVTETTILSNDSTTLVLAGTWEENTNNVFNISKTLDRTVYGSAVEGVGYEVFDSNINVTYAVNNIAQMTTLEFTNNSTSFTNVATNSVVYVKYTVVNFAYKVVGWEVDGQQLVSGDNEINDVLFNVNDNILAITNFTWGETAPQINIVYEPNEVTIHTELANADYADIDFANANGIFEENGLFKTYAGNLTTIQLNTKPSREVVDFGVENATLVNFASAIEDDYLTICDIVSDFTIKIAFDYTPFDVEILNVGEYSAVSIEYALNQGSFETLDGAITTKMTDVINVRIIINWGYELKNSNWTYDPSLCTIGELSTSTTADNKTIIETQISNYENAFSVEINPTKRIFNAYAQVGVLSNNEIQITESTNNTANVNISSAEYLTTLTYTGTEEIEGVNVGRINVNQKVYTFVGWYEYKNLEFVEFGDNNKSLTLQTTMLGD
ncbi:MAG: InlB B-repeat-containing protein, partial [Clostridia bacterium]|nr:InlB B-repeat-containing protein [Clostridia bacterium]